MQFANVIDGGSRQNEKAARLREIFVAVKDFRTSRFEECSELQVVHMPLPIGIAVANLFSDLHSEVDWLRRNSHLIRSRKSGS